jgi:hypothetical protein
MSLIAADIEKPPATVFSYLLYVGMEPRTWVIIPFLTGIGSRVHAAIANRCFGVTPPEAMFRRS